MNINIYQFFLKSKIFLLIIFYLEFYHIDSINQVFESFNVSLQENTKASTIKNKVGQLKNDN